MFPEGSQIPLARAAHGIGLISRANLVIFEFNVKFEGLNMNGVQSLVRCKGIISIETCDGMIIEENEMYIFLKVLIKCQISIAPICSWQPVHLSHQTLN